MGIFDRFPYSSTHEMNLDFMLGKATEIAESLQEIDTHKEQAEQAATNAAQSAQSAAQAAQAAAGSQAAAGTSASQAAQHKASAEDAADRAEAASDLADEAVEQAQTAAQNASTAATNASTAADGAIASAATAETRINTLAASLPEDFTELNNEVTYLKRAIDHFKNDVSETKFKQNTYTDTKFIMTKKQNEYINGVGSYQSATGYDSYEFKAEEQTDIYFEGTFDYLTMAVYSASPVSSDTIVGSRMKDSTIPTSESPYTVQAGYYVVITVYSDPLSFYSDYRNYQILGNALEAVCSRQFRINTQNNTDFSLTPKLGKYTGSNGSYADNSGYNSYEIIGTEDCQVYFDDTGFDYISFCVYNGTPSSSTLVGSRMRDSSLPSASNPYNLPSGYYGVISIQNSDILSFYTNYKNIEFNNSIRLSPSQIEQVQESLDTNLYRLYITNDIQSDHITISIYTQISATKKLRVDLYKYVYGTEVTTANANSNVWVMGGMYIVNNSFAVLDTVIIPLEWDCAIKEVGASDFMGGKQHGDEIYDSYYIYADGILLDPTQAITPFYCDAIQLVQTSKLNRVGSPTDYLLKHSKHIKITPKNVFCEQSFKALQTFQVNLSYSAMLPIAPDYASAFIRNGKAELEDIDSSGYIVTTTRGNKVWADIVGNNSIIRFEADSNSDLTPAFAITKGDNDHKCYYTMNADNTTWAQDKLLFSHYNFTFDVS